MLQYLILNYFLWQISPYKLVYFKLDNYIFILSINQVLFFVLVKKLPMVPIYEYL